MIERAETQTVSLICGVKLQKNAWGETMRRCSRLFAHLKRRQNDNLFKMEVDGGRSKDGKTW